MNHRLTPFHALAALALLLFVACGDETTIDAKNPTAPADDVESYHTPQTLEIESDLRALEIFDPVRADHAELTRQRLLGSGHAIEVPAGSVDALADAIAAAGPGGVVRVESGLHVESGPVEIGHGVTILGEPGAVIETGARPLGVASEVEAALYVNDANGGPGRRGRVTISGLTIRPAAGSFGGTGILVENTNRVQILFNTILAHQAGVILQQANNARVLGNRIEIEPSIAEHGIVVINGDRAGIAANSISGAYFGLWACDEDGYAVGNVFEQNVIGLIYCKVPTPAYPLPSGDTSGSENSATRWFGTLNRSSHNDWGYMVIDGSTDCTLAFNAASDNAAYDVHVVPDTEVLFGFCTPTAVNSTVVTVDDADVIKDCGVNSTIIGGTLVDTNLDPCEPPCTGGAGTTVDSPATRHTLQGLRARLGR